MHWATFFRNSHFSRDSLDRYGYSVDWEKCYRYLPAGGDLRHGGCLMAQRARYSDAELALETLKLELERHLRKVPCPVHGEHSRRVTVYGSSVYDMRFKLMYFRD